VVEKLESDQDKLTTLSQEMFRKLGIHLRRDTIRSQPLSARL
jgi:hypothetical protein